MLPIHVYDITGAVPQLLAQFRDPQHAAMFITAALSTPLRAAHGPSLLTTAGPILAVDALPSIEGGA